MAVSPKVVTPSLVPKGVCAETRPNGICSTDAAQVSKRNRMGVAELRSAPPPASRHCAGTRRREFLQCYRNARPAAGRRALELARGKNPLFVS